MCNIYLSNFCMCNWLDDDFNPINIKNEFSKKDELIIAWFEINELKQDKNICIIWFDSNNKEVFNVLIPVKKLNIMEKKRKVWSVMETSLLSFLKNNYGKWKITIIIDNIEMYNHTFFIKQEKNLYEIYNNKIKIKDFKEEFVLINNLV